MTSLHPAQRTAEGFFITTSVPSMMNPPLYASILAFILMSPPFVDLREILPSPPPKFSIIPSMSISLLASKEKTLPPLDEPVWRF